LMLINKVSQLYSLFPKNMKKKLSHTIFDLDHT